MHDWFVSLFGKIALSAASAVVAFIAGRLWKGFLKPWVWNLWYSGPQLGSRYRGQFTLNGKACSDLIEVNQKASKVWGMMTFPDGGHGRYKFEGTISGSVLRGTYNGIRSGPAACGVILMNIDSRTNDLEGWFVEPYQGAVISLPYKWTFLER